MLKQESDMQEDDGQVLGVDARVQVMSRSRSSADNREPGQGVLSAVQDLVCVQIGREDTRFALWQRNSTALTWAVSDERRRA